MWQRKAATKMVASTPWIGVFCTAMAVSMKTDVKFTNFAEAFLSQPSTSLLSNRSLRHPKPNESSSFSTVGIHRSQCEATSVSLSSSTSLESSTSNHGNDDTTKPNDTSLMVTSSSKTRQVATPSYKDYSSYEKVTIPERGAAKEHAIFGTLWGDSLIERYDVYRPVGEKKKSTNTSDPEATLIVVANITFGSHLNGHPGVVHGGILSLMFDDIMGYACGEVMMKEVKRNKNSKVRYQIPVTANLNVDFRKPVMAGTKVRMEVHLEEWEGRKLFWKARMFGDAVDSADKENSTLYAEATSLYVLINR